MASSKIVVLGATGNVGSALVGDLVSAEQAVRVVARNPGRLAHLAGPLVEVIAGDLDDPASLAAPLRGAGAAFLATSPSPDLDVQERHFIDAARAAGVGRLVKLSAFGIEHATDRIHLAHGRSERHLRASGLPWVALRPVVFMSNLRFDMAAIRAGVLPSVFGNGRISLIDPRDVAKVAARALLQSSYDGRTLELGGPQALSWSEVAAILTRVLGRPVEHAELDLPTFAAGVRDAGLPDFVIEAITATAKDAREGKYAIGDGELKRVLGRHASPLEDWVARHRELFAPDLAH